MGQNRLLLRLPILLLLFSCLLSLGSPALQRPVAKAIEEAIQDLKRKVSVEEGEGFVEGRMDFETLDYTGSGANNRHDPRSPGKP